MTKHFSQLRGSHMNQCGNGPELYAMLKALSALELFAVPRYTRISARSSDLKVYPTRHQVIALDTNPEILRVALAIALLRLHDLDS